MAAFILCFTSIYANFVIITWLPQFLIAERGFEGASVGFIASLVPWASIPGALIFARLNDKTGATKKLVYFLVPLCDTFSFCDCLCYRPHDIDRRVDFVWIDGQACS